MADQSNKPTNAQQRELLKKWFPWLGNDEYQSGTMTIDTLNKWFEEVGGSPIGNRFLNHYECTHNDVRRSGYGQATTQWSDESESTNNDKCPVCNAEIEPYLSEDL
jgi:hypothetical protein